MSYHINSFPLRLISWGVTNQCNLKCIYCYRDAGVELPGELSTIEGMKLMSEAKALENKVFILSGGEPLIRNDIFELAKYGTDIGLHLFLATTGLLLSEDVARRLRLAGVKGVSITIDGYHHETHDRVRGVRSSFKKAMKGIRNALNAGLSVQVNITALKLNYLEIPNIIVEMDRLGVSFIHVFNLIPTGRGDKIDSLALSRREQEILLKNLLIIQNNVGVLIKPTCMPYYWALMQEAKPAFYDKFFRIYPKGCIAGVNYAYVSPVGDVAPCPYMPLFLGNIRHESLKEIWNNSIILRRLRDSSGLKGSCGACRYRDVCGGCRAKALLYLGDFMEEDPSCPIVV